MRLFLNKIINLICSRCSNTDYTHHKGLINKFLIPSKNISLEFYNNYFNDVEHGFFHALSTCYIYYIINNNKIDEITIASLLLHDFLKCNGFSQIDHDIELRKYFSNLLEETYTHSNPKNENKLLIKCDRIELRRYSDYKDWVDDRYYKLYDDFNIKQKQEIEDFYNNIRPTLLYFYINRNEIFIRHGLEDINKCDPLNKFPPEKSYMTHDAIESYPIEIDRIPFGYITSDHNKQMGYCSNHGLKQEWNKIKGYITFKEFTNNGGKIINTNERDHLYAISNININKWKFLYQNVHENNRQIIELKKNNINIISQQIISEFYIFIKLFQDRLVVLNKI